MQYTKGTTNYDTHLKCKTIKELVDFCAEEYGESDAFLFHDKPNGKEIRKLYIDFKNDINALGTALISIGAKDSHIVVIGNNSYKWAVAHSTIINGVGISVPLDKQLAESEIISLTERGLAEYFFFDYAHLNEAIAVSKVNTQIKNFIYKNPEKDSMPEDPRFISYDDLMKRGYELIDEGNKDFSMINLDENAMCSLLFTSGTTALSKGVMLSHKNISGNICNINATIQINRGRGLSVLPLHHTLENSIGMYYLFASGICICYTDGLRYLSSNLKEWKITVMLGVPLLFENIYNQIQSTLRKTKKTKTVNIMRKVSNFLRIFKIDIRRKLFKKIIEGLGGEMELFVSGAAPIDVKIIQFFNDIGITFLMGYGLTETSPVISATSHTLNIYGSVGKPLANIEAAIDTEDNTRGTVGEILTKSDCVMLGYFQNEDATKEVFTNDGWFRTGDSGYLDKKGCIHVTGRLKSMIVLTNGKKVFPEEIELLTDRIQGIKESLVWGNESQKGTIDICAKFVIDQENLPEDCKKDDETISKYIEEQVKLVNTKMPIYKAIKYFLFTETDMIKTTTLKIKRPMEEKSIEQYLSENNFTMRSISGRRI